MLMKHTMSKHIRPFIFKSNASETYACLLNYHTMDGKQRTAILDEVQTISSDVIKDYVQEMRALQAQLISIEPNYDHPETKAPAYMTRILVNISEDQKKIIWVVRDRWRSRDAPTDLDCSQDEKTLQENPTDTSSTYY